VAWTGLSVLALGCHRPTVDLSNREPAILVRVTPDTDLDAGIAGQLQQPMSTAFQSAIWQKQFFRTNSDEADADVSPLIGLRPNHVLVQMYDSPRVDLPDGGWFWDFSELDAIVQPLLQLGQDPVLQIWPHDPSISPISPDFADYCATVLAYYNDGGVGPLVDGGTGRSPGGRIQWWSIWSDPNTGEFNVADGGALYAKTYRNIVNQMRNVDKGIYFVAPEVNDCVDQNNYSGQSSPCTVGFVADFLAALAREDADGAQTPIHALSVHMLSADIAVAPGPDSGVATDQAVFQTVSANFVRDIVKLRVYLADAGRHVPIWVTQNQVNSDVPDLDGGSAHAASHCDNCDVPFQADTRGTDGFFTAWRPYVYAALAKAGSEGLFQWQYTAGRCPDGDAGCSLLDSSDTDRQNAEIDYQSGAKYLSYWVDRTLGQMFGAGGNILSVQVTDDGQSDIETLAVGQPDGNQVVVMVVNHAVAGPSSIDGTGSPRTVVVDLSQILRADSGSPSDWSATKVTLDGKTDLDAGPEDAGVSLSNGWVPISFDGYGTTFLALTRTPPP